MPIFKHGLLAALLFVSNILPVKGQSPEATQVLASSRELVASGAIDRAIVMMESALENMPEDDYPIILEQLRKFYVVAINESRKAGRYELAEQYSHNLKLMDEAIGGGDVAADEPPVALKTPNPPPVAYQQLPRISREQDLQELKPQNSATEQRPVIANNLPSVKNSLEPADTQTQAPDSKVQQFDLAEADTAFRNKQFETAGGIYQRLFETGRLPATRRSHLAYCKCAEIVTQINANPKNAEAWGAINAELEQVQKIQPDFWFAEYLKDLVSERSSKTGNQNSTQLASNTGTGVISRAANQIRSISINPLRRSEAAR